MPEPIAPVRIGRLQVPEIPPYAVMNDNGSIDAGVHRWRRGLDGQIRVYIEYDCARWKRLFVAEVL